MGFPFYEGVYKRSGNSVLCSDSPAAICMAPERVQTKHPCHSSAGSNARLCFLADSSVVQICSMHAATSPGQVCLIGTSHFVAMGVMSADATLQDPRSDLESGGEEVIWHCEDATGSGRRTWSCKRSESMHESQCLASMSGCAGKQPDAAADPNLAEDALHILPVRFLQAKARDDPGNGGGCTSAACSSTARPEDTWPKAVAQER